MLTKHSSYIAVLKMQMGDNESFPDFPCFLLIRGVSLKQDFSELPKMPQL